MTSTARQKALDQMVAWNFDYPAGTPVKAYPGLRSDEPLVTRTRSAAWLLPAGDVVVLVDGHAGGIALDHVDHDPTRRPAVPDVVHETPPCPICGDGLGIDGDTLTCDPCQASWNTAGRDGRWFDPTVNRCPATWRPLLTRPDVEQCIRAEGHHDSSSHMPPDGIGSWVDTDTRAVTDSYGDLV